MGSCSRPCASFLAPGISDALSIYPDRQLSRAARNCLCRVWGGVRTGRFQAVRVDSGRSYGDGADSYAPKSAIE